MEKEIKIDLVRCFKAVLQRWWIIAICAMIFFAVALVASNIMISTTYNAETTVYGSVYGDTQESLEALTVMQTYSDIIMSRKVADRAALLLGDEELSGDVIQGMVTPYYSETSAVEYIDATSDNAEDAVAVANAVAESFVIEAQNILGDNSVQILDKATYAEANGTSKKLVYSLIALIIGALIPFSIIIIREILSDKIYHVADASLDGEIPIIGIIPIYDKM